MKPFDPTEKLPNRHAVEAELKKDPTPQVRESSDRSSGTPRRRMIGGGSKLGVDCTKLIERGYHPYWRNDLDGRVQEALANGYEFVSPSEIEETSLRIGASELSDDKVSRIVGYTEKGEPIKAYLMKIKEEWFKENQAFYQNRAKAIDDAIRTGTTTPVEGAYSPREGISYQARTR